MDVGSPEWQEYQRLTEERNKALQRIHEREHPRSVISKLIGDKGHRTQGIVTLAFVLFLIIGLMGFFD